VRRRTLVDEATALGAAVVGGVGVGLYDDFSVAQRMSEQAAPCEPDPAAHARYRREHAVFLDAYRRLEPWFESL
jgi:xylulokinase